MNVGKNNSYAFYVMSAGGSSFRPPVSDGTINGVNITAMNRRTRVSYATAKNAVSTWYSRVSNGGGNRLTSVCWSPELGIYVAVGYAGTLVTSPNGVTWTAQTSNAGTNNLLSVAWSPELSLFVAVGNSGTVISSSNGTTWNTQAALSGFLYSVTWSSELSLFVIVGSSNTRTSSTGASGSWATQTGSGYLSVTWSPELSLFVAVGGSGNVSTSSNGTTWNVITNAGGNTQQLNAVAWSPELSLFVAVGVASATPTATILTSPNGRTWTVQNISSSITTQRLNSVCWSPELSLFIVTGQSGTIITSADGVTWTAQTSPTTNALYSTTWSPELSTFVVAGDVNTILTSAPALPAPQNTVKAPKEQFTINPNTGNIGIGTTNPQYSLDVVGQARFANATGTGVYLATLGATSWSATSDMRVKKDITELPGSLDTVNQLRPVKYHWINDIDSAPFKFGFIAQELEQVIPELVNTTNSDIKAIATTEMIPFLVKAVQELTQENTIMKDRISALESFITNT